MKFFYLLNAFVFVCVAGLVSACGSSSQSTANNNPSENLDSSRTPQVTKRRGENHTSPALSLPNALSIFGTKSQVSGPNTLAQFNGSSIEFSSRDITMGADLDSSLYLDLRDGTVAEVVTPSGFTKEPKDGCVLVAYTIDNSSPTSLQGYLQGIDSSRGSVCDRLFGNTTSLSFKLTNVPVKKTSDYSKVGKINTVTVTLSR